MELSEVYLQKAQEHTYTHVQFNQLLFFFSQTIIINTQVNNNKQIIENIHNL